MKIKNRSAHRVGYSIPNGARRVLNAGETIDVSIEEIGQLMYQPGGKTLIEKYLWLPEECREALNWDQDIQPEYNYSEEDIKSIMVNGTLDEFLDMIDFAPEGVITLIRQIAVNLPLSDMNKMEAFKQKFNYDIAAAIKNQKAVEAELKGEENSENTTTRQRRVQPSKYKVIQ